MKKFCFFLYFGLASVEVLFQPSTPRQMYRDLFTAIQMKSIFQDEKTFVDCTPNKTSKEIVKQYEEKKRKSGFDLKQFVQKHFNLPENHQRNFHSDTTASINQQQPDGL